MKDDPSVPTDVWMDERLGVRDSPIEGSGLFFTSDLPAGTIVIRLGGRLVSSTELDTLMRQAEDGSYVDTIAMYRDVHLVLPANTPIHFGNHSCDPTMWLVDPLEIATRRDVSIGEEAALDYATISGGDGFAMACRCGSQHCRGEVTGTDWRRVEHSQPPRPTTWVPSGINPFIATGTPSPRFHTAAATKARTA